jgi:carboxypeptidase C (cathepsin A)
MSTASWPRSPRAPAAVAVLGTLLIAGITAHARAAEMPGEEPIVTTHHAVTVGDRTLRYTARAGRLPIRDNETGDVHGQMFFVAYALDRAPGTGPRPLTFAWNGGPGSNAALVHLVGFGPKRIAPPRTARAGPAAHWVVEPNPESWLDATDLVFVDPIGTGYSRPTRAEYGPEFYQTRGDAESVAEFVRVYRTRFDAWDAPIFLAGESYGVVRAAGVADALQRRGTEVRGVILLGLALPLGTMSPAMRTALGLPGFTVAAFTHRKLAPDLQRDLDSTIAQSQAWAVSRYAQALERRDSLPDAEREAVIRNVARFIGLDPSVVDRRGLAVNRLTFSTSLLKGEGRVVGHYDSRMTAPLDTTQQMYDPTRDPSLQDLLDDVTVLRYLRQELGYESDLRYQGPFGGGYPPPTAFRGDWMSTRWAWPAAQSARSDTSRAGGARRGAAADSSEAPQPLRDAMRTNPSLRVLVGCGIYDLVCSACGNAWSAANLEPSLRRNVIVRSYPGGHAMYTDPRAHAQLKRDVARFIGETLSVSGRER